jgi:nickel/cobalt exporter
MDSYMTRRRPILALAAVAALVQVASAHPMGNFSVSHYTRIEVQQTGTARVTYVLDLAELPTFELLQKWDLKQDSPAAQIEAKAAIEAKSWVANLKFLASGKRIPAHVLDTKIVMADGAGNLPIARVTSHLEVPLNSTTGALEYEDTNYPERAGWKEIVIGAAKGVTLIEASHIDVERSKALTVYPTDPTIAPPQDLHARLEWKLTAGPASPILTQKPVAATTAAAPVPQQVGGRPTPAAPGEVTKGDALSQLLSKRDLSVGAIALALFMAFWFGCLHATTPGHGKTMVAAYLVGERGTPKHAIFLGAMVTFTHTISVFALGVATYFLAGSFAPETVTKVLSIISGLMIVIIGLWLLYKRSMQLVAAQQPAPAHKHHHHHHDHDHHHEHAHAPVLQLVVAHKHDHGHEHHHHDHHDHGHQHDAHHHDHGHAHDHGHHHGPGGHSHVPEGPVTFGSLVALGASGGLVPCPSALVLLLSSISFGRIGFGLALLVSFSLGLAGVLMAIGLGVLYAKHLLPKTEKTIKHPLVKLIPVLSAGVITVIGIAMTTIALGWIKVAGV